MQLVILGGAHGVGKTTLIEQALMVTAGQFTLFDPGEFFWRHLFEQCDKTAAQVEALVVKKMIKLTKHTISSWHYAAWTQAGWVPQLRHPLFREMIRTLAPQSLTLGLIEAPAIEILARRKKDQAIKKRKLDLDCIEEELQQNRIFRLACWREVAELTDVQLVDINNTDLLVSTNLLTKILSSLL